MDESDYQELSDDFSINPFAISDQSPTSTFQAPDLTSNPQVSGSESHTGSSNGHPASLTVHSSQHNKPNKDSTLSHVDDSSISRDRMDSLGDSSIAQTTIMMYSPDIPSAQGRHRVSSSNLGGYYSMIETEESVKCVVSTVLFVVILAAMFLVAVLKNPEM